MKWIQDFCHDINWHWSFLNVMLMSVSEGCAIDVYLLLVYDSFLVIK